MAVMLLCDVVLDGVELDWSIHVPLMLHIVFLGMDHTRYVFNVVCSFKNLKKPFFDRLIIVVPIIPQATGTIDVFFFV